MPRSDSVNDGLLAVLGLDAVGQRPRLAGLEHPLQAPGHAAEIVLLHIHHAPAALGEFPLHDLDEPLLHRIEVLPRERWRAHDELFAQRVAPIAALGLPDLKRTFTG